MPDNEETKLTILLKAFDHAQTNSRFLQQKEQTISSWIGSVLLAILGVVAALGPAKIAAFGISLKLGLTIVVCSLFLFAWITEVMIFKARLEAGRSAEKIARLLHFFEVDYFAKDVVISDEADWTDWKKSRLRHWGIQPATSVLFVLTIVAIFVVWVS